jgi:DNA-binding XRE family transcriptional regulator
MPDDKPPRAARSRSRQVLRAVPDLGPDAQSSVHIGNRLRELREQCNLTQEVAAVNAGITRNTLGELEGSRFPNPQLSTLLGLMQCYGLSSLDALLGPMPAARVANAWEDAGWPNKRQRRGRG